MDFYLENKGQIPAPFSFNIGLNKANISFLPSSGVVDVHAKVPVQIKFTPTSLGSFEEAYSVIIHGSTTPLSMLIKCVSLGPTFDFDVNCLSFGQISAGFATHQQITLVNTSPIAFSYAFDLESNEKHWFTVKPDHGVIPANGSRLIKVTCSPRTLGRIVGTLFLDVKEIGRRVYDLSITGEALVPKVISEFSFIILDNC